MIADLIGTWNMVHDDWRGTLVINPSYQRLNGVDGPCTYVSYVFDGSYTGADGTPLLVRGTIGGKDDNQRTNAQCPQSDHLVNFTIDFPGQPPQQFTGYLFTQQKRTLAGETWWQGIPFGWYATKI
jgi:hypothetical protein